MAREKLRKDRLTGFQRWFCNVVGQGVPIRYGEYALHVGCFLWTVLALAAIVFTIGWLWKLPLLILVVGSVVLYVALVRKGHEMAEDPSTQLEWYQRPFWFAILHVGRALKWTGYDPSLSDRMVLDQRGESLNDTSLPKLVGLSECEVLDLEGCSITERSVVTLEKLKELKCLVVCDTGLGSEAVGRIQRCLPSVWIWY